MSSFSALLALFAAAPLLTGAVQFNRDVRPILSDKCFTCHGPDAASKKVPFRLDREAFAKADLGSGRHAIVPGDLNSSALIQRITSANKAQRMPPAYVGLQLSEREIETLKQWIQEGAKWEQHWSFTAPQRPPVPAIQDPWVRNPIDAFILDRLRQEKLTPRPQAPPETLLRRVALDLTGLPPDPAAVNALLADKSPGAYERAVDRLLASPRYGERMASRWLDAARYADTNGYQYDGERVMWRWRDWVIDAFNRNQPYNDFTRNQLAGDLIPHASLDQKIATGFNRNHRMNTEDGIVPEEYFVEQVVDRVETTSTVFMGLTLGCARCHNHKYDPLLQKDFYQFYAYFNNLPELGRGMKYGNTPPQIPAPTREQQARLDAFDANIKRLQTYIDSHVSNVPKSSRWKEWTPLSGLDYTLTEPQLPRAPGREAEAFVFDGKSMVDAGSVASYEIDDPFTISAWINSSNADGSIASRMSDKPQGKGYGVHLNHGHVHVNVTSNYADDANRVETEEVIAPNEWHHVAVTVDGSRLASGISVYIDGKPARLRIENATLYRPFRNAGAVFKEPLRLGAGWGPERRFTGLMEGVRVYSRVLTSDELGALAQIPWAEGFATRQWYLENQAAPDIRAAAQQLAAAKLDRDRALRSYPTVMVMQELPTPRDAFLLDRGAYDKPTEKVPRGVPAVLPPLPSGVPNDRLALANWLVSGTHPLTARVAVNRYWQMLFGTGIVKTTEDFGVQGEWPTHPELLDWLATEFVRTGWDTKAMLRLIVTSSTYRQSSKADAALLQRDPENRLLARGPRFRLPAEMIRDQALFAAGLLTEKIGGPSVKPYQPAGLWKETSMQDMDYVQSHGADLYRRSLYTFWKRTIAPPMMMNFDAAGRETCVVRDSRTNTPLQALDLMNDVTFVEAARALGQRMVVEGGADADSRLRYGFRLVTARAPSPDEQRVLRDNLAYHLDYYASKAGAAAKLLEQGEAPVDKTIEPGLLAAYASVGSLLLNMDEAVTKE